MAAVPPDFRGYDTPGMCVAAAQRTRAFWDRRFVRDTTVFLMDARRTTSDTLPTVVVDLARRCGARFTVANVPKAELYNLIRLALFERDDDKAESALARQLAVAASDTERAGALWDAYNLYQTASPRRDALSARATARLSALGGAARDLRMQQLLRQNASAELGSVALDQSAASLDSLSRLFPERDTMYIGAVNVTLQAGAPFRATQAIYRGLQHGTVRTGTKVIATVDSAMAATTDAWLARFKTPEMRELVAGQLKAWSEMVAVMNTGWGLKPINITGDFWYGDTIVPGKVTVAVFLDRGVRINDQNNETFRQADWLKLAQFRELARRFPKDSLQLVVIVPTRGYAWGSGLLTPKQEADVTAWYFRERLQLPATVVVVETKYSSNLIDGHRENEEIQWQRQYGEQSVFPRLISKDGIDQTYWESMFNEYIYPSVAREIARPHKTFLR